MNATRTLGAWLLALLLCGAASAQLRVEGHTFDAQARVADADLRLNGAGLRANAWIKGYTVGLYLPHKSSDAPQVLAMPGPKRLQMRMLLDVPAEEFVKAFERGVTRNTADDELAALKSRMQQFDRLVAAVGKVRKGDVVNLDFVPALGLVFSLNGKVRGDAIPGHDLYAALLRIFIGARPTSAELKAGLLGS